MSALTYKRCWWRPPKPLDQSRRRAGQIAQAIADLDDILAETADQTRAALPEAELTRVPRPPVESTGRRYNLGTTKTVRNWRLSFQDANLDIALWTDVHEYLDDDDPYVVGGTITIAVPGGWIAANLVCEEHDNRLVWSLLQFRVSAFGIDDYQLGPIDQYHGLNQPNFIEQRPHMLPPAIHIWNLATTALTPSHLLGLLRTAIEASGQTT